MTTKGTARWSLVAAAVLALAPPRPARAGEESGLSLGARLGYGMPLGDARAGISLGDVVIGQVPFQLDAWWRFDRSWRLGLYGQAGITPIARAFCPAGASCSGWNYRAGLQAAYAFASDGPRPWAGLGIGVEAQAATVTAGSENKLLLFGFELLNLQGGLDWRLSGRLALGPFAAFSLGQYRTATSGGVSQTLATAMHGWVQLGVRGSFDF